MFSVTRKSAIVCWGPSTCIHFFQLWQLFSRHSCFLFLASVFPLRNVHHNRHCGHYHWTAPHPQDRHHHWCSYHHWCSAIIIIDFFPRKNRKTASWCPDARGTVMSVSWWVILFGGVFKATLLCLNIYHRFYFGMILFCILFIMQ